MNQNRLEHRVKRILGQLLLIILALAFFVGQDEPVGAIIEENDLNYKNTAESGLLEIQKLNIEAKYRNRFVSLDELVVETIASENFEEQNPLPQILNGTEMRINTTYGTFYDRSDSLVIHEFVVDVYFVQSDEEGNRTIVGGTFYRYQEPEDTVLLPNSSKAESFSFPLYLSEYGTYKFVFRAVYHIFKGDELPKETYYPQNISFLLVKSYATPPYIILYIFYGVVIAFIAILALGVYGQFRFKGIE